MLERLDERELLLESINFCWTKQERYINYFFKYALPVLLKYTQSSFCYIYTSMNYNY